MLHNIRQLLDVAEISWRTCTSPVIGDHLPVVSGTLGGEQQCSLPWRGGQREQVTQWLWHSGCGTAAVAQALPYVAMHDTASVIVSRQKPYLLGQAKIGPRWNHHSLRTRIQGTLSSFSYIARTRKAKRWVSRVTGHTDRPTARQGDCTSESPGRLELSCRALG